MSKIKRAGPQSRCHSYAWLYDTVKTHLESTRQDKQEGERLAAVGSKATHPLTPAPESEETFKRTTSENNTMNCRSAGTPRFFVVVLVGTHPSACT